MTLERFRDDKDIARISEDIMAILMTVKDFGIDSETFAFAIKSIGMLMYMELTKNKDITASSREETKQYSYGFLQVLLTKSVGIHSDPTKEVFMLDYLNANRDKLVNDCISALGVETDNSSNLTIN